LRLAPSLPDARQGRRHWPFGGVTEADETYLRESKKGARR
jgi:hypothetical protein